MTIGGNGFEPNVGRIAVPTDSLVPVNLAISTGTTTMPEIDGANLTLLTFECKPLGHGEDAPSTFLNLVMPEDVFIELSTHMGRHALSSITRDNG